MPFKKITGPLSTCKKNPRYFAGPDGKAVYLTGSHTWNTLVDKISANSPMLDFTEHLDFLEKFHHNFIRLWTQEIPAYPGDDRGTFRYNFPLPWLRKGPGKAQDLKAKFDLTKFDPAYFTRLRERVQEAGSRGIYVSIMLFEGWGIQFHEAPWCWKTHPFNMKNNLNGIDGDRDKDGKGLEIHTLKISKITAIQEAYVRQLIDTVNDLDNVLYEICNETNFSYSKDWQYHFIRFIHEYEKGKGKQHPVGMTGYGPCDNSVLFNSPADWISPGLMTHWANEQDPMKFDPPGSDGCKVLVSDTDHIWGVGGTIRWIWTSLTRGYYSILMDPYKQPWIYDTKSGSYRGDFQKPPYRRAEDNKVWNMLRKNQGYALQYAERVNMTLMRPLNHLAMSGYCLANPGESYIVYIPEKGETAIDLSSAANRMMFEWFNPRTGKLLKKGRISGGKITKFFNPAKGEAVLFIFREPISQ